MAVKTMFARYAGKCSGCSGMFAAGTEIKYDTAARTAAHAACPEVPLAALPAAPMFGAESVLARYEAVAEAARSAAAESAAIVTEVYKAARAAFEAAGGCPACEGKGRVEYHFLDGYGGTDPCSKCGSTGGTAGVFEISKWAAAAGCAGALAKSSELKKAADAGSSKATRLRELLGVERGAVVEVVSGRKVPLGTKGIVIWIGSGENPRWGLRVGVKKADGEVVWTARSNVEVAEVEATEWVKELMAVGA